MNEEDKKFLAHSIMEWTSPEYSDDCFQTDRSGPDSVIHMSEWNPDKNENDFNELINKLKEMGSNECSNIKEV